MNQADIVIDWLLKGEPNDMPPLIEEQNDIRLPVAGRNLFKQTQPTLTGTKQIRVIDQSPNAILVEVLSGDDLMTPEERAANYYAHDNHEDEQDEDY